MQNLFLTSEKKAKKEYKKLIKETSLAITKAFIDDRAYSGPTPQELKEIVKENSILPENGLGWKAVFSKIQEKVLPNLLRTPSTDYMPHLHGPSL